MKIVVCDKCHKEIVRSPRESNYIPVSIHMLGTYDLCDKCKDEFIFDFMGLRERPKRRNTRKKEEE